MASLAEIRRGLVDLLEGVALSGIGHGVAETHLRELNSGDAAMPGFVVGHGTFLVEWRETVFDDRQARRTRARSTYDVSLFTSTRAILGEQTQDIDDAMDILERARAALQVDTPWGATTVTSARSVGLAGTTYQAALVVSVSHSIGA